MKTYKISVKFPFETPVLLFTVCSAGWLILNLLPIPVTGQLEPAWINPVLAAILLAFFGTLEFGMHRCTLILNENGLVYTPVFGSKRNLSYQDLQKVTTGGKSYCIYTQDGKKLVTFDDAFTENASEIIAFLKHKGVKAEF